MKRIAILGPLLLLSQFFFNTNVAQGSTSDECGFGMTTAVDFDSSGNFQDSTGAILNKCVPIIWTLLNNNDGFSKTITVYMEADNHGSSDLGTELTSTIEIQCTNKKLGVLIYSEPIGIYPQSDLTSQGFALAKIDSGKVLNIKYVEMKDFSGIAILAPKALTSIILKTKKQFSFKINSSVQAATVANFPIGDLSSYVSKFKALGCPIK